MKCPNCAADLSDHAHFCPMCGTEIDTAYCSICGNQRKAGGGGGLDKLIALLIVVSVGGYLGYAYMQTHESDVRARVAAGVRHLTNKGGELFDESLEVGAGVVDGLVDKMPDAPEEEVAPEEDRYEMVDDHEVELADKKTYDMKAVVGPGLDHTQLSAIAHSILDDRIAEEPDNIFVLSVFDAEPTGSALMPEHDPNFVAKFLYLNRLHVPGESIPEDYVEISPNLFAKWG